MVMVKTLLMLVIIVCFVSIILLAHYLDRVNLQVIQVYCSLRLADVTEVLAKCNSFLGQRGLKTMTRQRTVSLIKVPINKANQPARRISVPLPSPVITSTNSGPIRREQQ